MNNLAGLYLVSCRSQYKMTKERLSWLEWLVLVLVVAAFLYILATTSKGLLIRHQVDEGLLASSKVQVQVQEYRATKGVWPATTKVLELQTIHNKYVKSVRVNSGVITLVYSDRAVDVLQGKTLSILPRTNERGYWQCQSFDIDLKYLPRMCR